MRDSTPPADTRRRRRRSLRSCVVGVAAAALGAPILLGAGVASAATAPTVTIYTAEHYFSPNGDGSDDHSAIGYCINSNVAGGGLSQQVLLTVVVTDSANIVVRTLETGVAHDSDCFSQVDWDG